MLTFISQRILRKIIFKFNLFFQLSVIRENQTLAKSKRAGSPFLDWTTLDTSVERKRKWVEIDLIDTDSERDKAAKQELLEALLEQEGLCWFKLV